jgi:competence protein CoiA
MKYALVNGQRQEAQPKLSGECPGCGSAMIAKCGERRLRVWHWAHEGGHDCDPWWENQTEWHRAWKNHFPAEWQEIFFHAKDGERHIADVKTDDGWVIEFQHSNITPEERRSREAFYQKMIWVVNGTRLKRDRAQLIKALDASVPIAKDTPMRRVHSDNCGLLQKWAGSNVPIFLDFGEPAPLWLLFCKSTNGPAYLLPFQRAKFIECHRSTGTEIARRFDEFVNKFLPTLIADYESPPRPQPSRWDPLQLRRPRRRRL